MTRVLITGGTGYVGWHLVQTFRDRGYHVGYTVHRTDHVYLRGPYFSLDVTDASATAEIVRRFDPDITIHTAAVADADRCEREPELATDVHVRGTKHVVDACEMTGSIVVFVSSSFVFSGERNPYVEDDRPDPINHYGATKVRAEEYVRDADQRSLIIRTDQPYGWTEHWHDATMITWLLDRLSTQSEVEVFEDWHNTPIYIHDLADFICDLVALESNGTYHVVGSEFVSRYDWARHIASAFDADPDRIVPIHSETAELPAERPNARLSNQKLVTTTGREPRHIASVLRHLRRATDS